MLFGFWGIFLSGIMAPFIGSPGVIQAVRLSNLLDAKQIQLAKIETEITRLDGMRYRLETSRTAQEHEIRRVLGYAAPDEIIFDFTSPDQISRN